MGARNGLGDDYWRNWELRREVLLDEPARPLPGLSITWPEARELWVACERARIEADRERLIQRVED